MKDELNKNSSFIPPPSSPKTALLALSEDKAGKPKGGKEIGK
jgi:hypothetical protein